MDQSKLKFDELVKLHTRNIHSALLEGGGNKMESAIHNAMCRAIEWSAKNTEQPTSEEG